MSRFLLSASLLALALPAAAQNADHDHDEVIVTGIFADRNSDEIITNISVLDREEIVSDLRTTLGDTLDREPGISTTFFGAGASRPVLRGLGSERVLVLTNGMGVIDVSAASPDHQVGADGIDAERIEVLRGPAALAFGGQAIGGVVNVIDGTIAEEMPDEAFEGDAYGAYNSAFDGLEGAARLQGAVGPLVLTGSISARDFEDYDIPGEAESEILEEFEEMQGEEHDEEEEGEEGVLGNSFVETLTLSGGASLIFENGFVGVGLRTTDAEYGLPGGHAHEEGEEEEEEEEEEENPFIDLDQTRIDLRAGVNLDGAISALRASAVIADYEHTEFEAPGEAGTIYERDGWEGRLEARTAFSDLTGAFGVQFVDNDLFAFGEEAFITPTDTQSQAAFLFQRYKTSDDTFSVEGGLRLENVDYDNAQFGEADFNLLSASLGAHFHPAEAWFFGLEAAYTERAPNESELFSDGVHLATRQFERGNANLSDEAGLNLEATVRYDLGNTRIGANVFITNFDDFIALLPGQVEFEGEITDEVEEFPVFVFSQSNADFFGGEIYAETDIEAGFADLALRASVDFVDGELENDINVPLLPPVTFNFSVDADFGLILAGADVTFAGDQDDPGPGQLATDGYTEVDLSLAADVSDLGFGADGTQVFLQLRNVFDEDIRYATSTLKDLAPAPGRNLRAGLRVAF